MSFSLTYTELVNVAIPQCGVVNFKALHLLLQGILDHIQIAELKKVLSGDEDFLQASPVMLIPREGDAQPIINPMKRLSNIFDHVVDRMEKIEVKLAEMQGIPTTAKLLEDSQGTKRPAEDMWNNIKIQKRIEGNELATEKFAKTLQDLLSDLHVTKSTVETVKKDMDTVKFVFEKLNPQKMELLCDDLKVQNRKLGALQREVVTLQNKVRAIPQPEEMVLWSSLHEAMFSLGKHKPEVEPSTVRQSVTSLPESPLEQQPPEDVPIPSATPMHTMVQFGTTGILKGDEFTRAVEFADSQGIELGQASVSQTHSLRQAVPVPVSVPVSVPVGIPASVPVSVPVSAPVSVPVSVPAGVPARVPVSAPVSVPAGVPVSAPVSVPAGVPTGVPVSVPAGVPAGVPVSVPAGVPVSVPAGVPVSVPAGVPVSAPVSVPAGVPVSAPVSVPAGVPVSAPVSVPAGVPVSAPVSVPAGVPVSAPVSVPAGVPVSAPVSVPAGVPVSAPVSVPAGVPGFASGPGFMPVFGPRPGMVPPGVWTSPPRAWARGNVWPVWDMGPYQTGPGPIRPMGQMARARFSVMDTGIPWTMPQTYRLPGLEERGDEYEYFLPGPREEMRMDEIPQEEISEYRAPQEEISEYGAPEEEIPSEGASQEEMSTEGAPSDGIRKGRVPREKISKVKAPRYRTPKERVSHHRAPKDVGSQEMVIKEETPEVKVLKKVIYKDKTQKDKASEQRHKAPPPALKKLRSAITIAAAAAAAYAAAANSAAQVAKDAAKAIQDVPATQMAAEASRVASSVPLGAFADILGAGFRRGATINLPFRDEEMEEFPEEFTAPFNPFPAKPVLSQAMINAMYATSPEEKKKAVQYSMSHIAQMPIRHDSLKEEFANLSTNLNQRLNYLANMGSSGVLGNTVNVLEEKIVNLQKARLQEEELERVWGHQIDTMKSHYMVLDRAVERLQVRMDDLKVLKAELERLDLVKADKTAIDLELNEKADRDMLASKANRVDLETVAMDLNEMIHSLLLKITNYESDWKKSLKHLRKDLNTKLVQSDLNSLKKDIEEVWNIVRKLLLEGLRFDPDSAAGFKKKLFERVKCISCDRPVEMMTGPQLITIRNIHGGLSRIRPASANSYEYLQRQLMREQQQQLHFQTFGVHEEGLGLQKDWGDGPRNETILKHKSHDLTTFYPYGDPELMDYDTAEVDILGVNGILYKGRMCSQIGTRMGEKDLAAVKVSCHTVQNLIDRVRPGSLLASGYPPLGPRTSINSATSLHSATTMMARSPSLPPGPQLPPLIPVSRDPQEAPGSAKRLKSPRL
uniref:DUF4795 domain-containing protein n=1 Tax=Rattus norvegicus TaxID=10116 RepID=A0ABK0L5D2_RAT